jgi:hypothetical protein
MLRSKTQKFCFFYDDDDYKGNDNKANVKRDEKDARVCGEIFLEGSKIDQASARNDRKQ